MNLSGSRILIPISRNVALSRIVHLLFAIASTSPCSISITFCCASTNVYTSMACCTFNCTFVDNCSSFVTTFSSLASFYIVCASTKCYSLASSSSDSSMHIRSIDVALSPVYFLAHQHHLLLHKNSSANVPVVSMSRIIVYANYIFSLYVFPSTHFEDVDECGGDLTTNG